MNFHPLLFGFAAIFLFMWVSSTFSNIAPPAASGTNDTSITIAGEEAAAGLELAVLPELVKKAKTAEDLEKILNADGGPNNLDLNADGIVDFIHVTEFSNAPANAEAKPLYGFSLTVAVTPEEEQEIAVIAISEAGDNANVAVSGNEQVYGRSAHYSAFYPLSTFFMMSYLLSPHRSFFSPYGYGRYPGYYNNPRTASANAYQDRTRGYTSASRNATGANLKSPNAAKSAPSIKKSLRNPTATQRAFQTRASSQRVGSGGFGRTRSGTTRGFGTRSARSFGSASRSFGGGFGK